MNRKKLLTILLILAIGAILGGAYWYFSKKPTTPGASTALFPGEGRTSTTKKGTGAEEDTTFTPDSGKPIPRLYELHKTPVVGAGFFEEGNTPYQQTSVRYIDRGLGYIYETPLLTYAESRIVNETRPHLSEAIWGNKGKSVVVRSLNEKDRGVIETQILNISAPISESSQNTSAEGAVKNLSKTEEISLPDNIPFMATAEDGSDIFFYLEEGEGVTAGTVSSFKYFDTSKIFNSAFTEWLPQFPKQTLVTLTTKPSVQIPGYLYFIDQNTKTITKILSDVIGLTALTSHDGRFVLYSETRGATPEISLYDTIKKERHSLGLKTLAEKCVWGNTNKALVYCAVPQNIIQGEYPDQWYQGVIAFSDDLWEIDTQTFMSKKVMSPIDFGSLSFDIINPVLSSDDGHLLFMNKLTGTPWIYRFAEASPVISGATQSATPAESIPAQTSQISPDMKKIK